MGAIEDFDRTRFGGPTVPEEVAVVIGTTATPVLKADPDRLLVIMGNNDAGPIYWSTSPRVSALEGFAVGSGIATTIMVQNDGALCGEAIWAIAPAGPYTLNVLTLRRQRRG